MAITPPVRPRNDLESLQQERYVWNIKLGREIRDRHRKDGCSCGGTWEEVLPAWVLGRGDDQVLEFHENDYSCWE